MKGIASLPDDLELQVAQAEAGLAAAEMGARSTRQDRLSPAGADGGAGALQLASGRGGADAAQTRLDDLESGADAELSGEVTYCYSGLASDADPRRFERIMSQNILASEKTPKVSPVAFSVLSRCLARLDRRGICGILLTAVCI